MVGAFITAARAGDLAGIIAVLAPDVIRRLEPASLPEEVRAELRGGRGVAEGTVVRASGARFAQLIMINGTLERSLLREASCSASRSPSTAAGSRATR